MGDDLITNRKALRDYQILETYEAGIVLRGTEVKSLRAGQGNLTDAFARIEKNEVWLYKFDIQPYKQANTSTTNPRPSAACSCTGRKSANSSVSSPSRAAPWSP